MHEPQKRNLAKAWLLMLVLGFLLVAVGLVAMSATWIATLAAVYVLDPVPGGGRRGSRRRLSARRWRGFWTHLLAGILYLVLGFLMVQRPLASAATFTLMIAAVLFIGGLFRIAIAVTERYQGWVWGLLNGVISVVLGVMIWRDWPDSAFWVIGLFVGIDMVFAGLAWVMTALSVRDVAAKLT